MSIDIRSGALRISPSRIVIVVLTVCFVLAGTRPVQAQWAYDVNPNHIKNNNSGNVGIGTGAAPIPALLSFPETTAADRGIWFGDDTKLYRSAEGILESPGLFLAGFVIGSYGLFPTLFGSAEENGNLNIQSTASTQKGTIFISQNGGNVIIGPPNGMAPEQLRVNGSINVTGNINAKYQDIAEWVATSRPLQPGTVVVLDPSRVDAVIPSFESYDLRVAGVVSANPGIVLGEAEDGKDKIATTGRVRVRVDATDAAIHIGDLLVSSSKEGMAMRSIPMDINGVKIHRPGTLIGKALQSLETGEGEILVLLSLQ